MIDCKVCTYLHSLMTDCVPSLGSSCNHKTQMDVHAYVRTYVRIGLCVSLILLSRCVVSCISNLHDLGLASGTAMCCHGDGDSQCSISLGLWV